MPTSSAPDEPALLPRGDEKRLFAIVAGVALLVRALHLLAIRDAAFFSLYMGDAMSYHRWALELQAGEWLGDRVFYQAPLYPYFMGVVYTVIGNHPMVLKAVQALLGAAGCGLVAVAGARLVSRRTGAVAGGLLALYAPALYFDGIVQKASLSFFLAALLLFVLAESACRAVGERPGADRKRLWLGLGAIFGFFVLARENAVLLVLPLLAWTLYGGGRAGWRPSRSTWTRAAALLLGAALVLGPVALRNQAVSGEFHLTTSQFGPNFYMGNNPEATGLPQPLRLGRDNPRFEQRDAVELAERATGRELSPGEVSAYWTDRALAYITDQPLDWLELMGRKVALLWNDVEIGDTEDLYTHARASPALAVLSKVFRFGVLAPLALLGLWITRHRTRRLWPFWAVPAVYLASVLLFFLWARYRFPAVPFLALFAGAGLAGLPDWLSRSGWREVVPVGGAVGLAALLSFWPLVPVEGLRSGTRMSIGAALERREGLEASIPHYRRALELDPDNATAHFYLATTLQRQGRLEAALRHYREAVRLQPGRAEIRNNLGVALVAAGELGAAERQFRRATETDPGYGQAWENLGVLARNRGDLQEATGLFRRAVEADPGLTSARIRLGDALVMRGELDEAFRHYRRAAERGAARQVLDHVLPTAWTMATHPDSSYRRPERALELARRLVAIEEPPDPRGLRALAAALARNGRFEEATDVAERALEAARRESGDGGQGSGPPSADPEAIRSDLARYRTGEPVVAEPPEPAGAEP